MRTQQVGARKLNLKTLWNGKDGKDNFFIDVLPDGIIFGIEWLTRDYAMYFNFYDDRYTCSSIRLLKERP